MMLLRESLENGYICETLDVSDAEKIHIDANTENITIFES